MPDNRPLSYELYATKRGLLRADFVDRNGKDCSIQESSATAENLLWLGVDVEEGGGRMHLTQDMVLRILPMLRHFAREGKLAVLEDQAFHIGAWVRGVGPTTLNVVGRVISIHGGTLMVVQDEAVAGERGQHTTHWDHRDTQWEPYDRPDDSTYPTVYDRLTQEGDQENHGD